MLTGLQRLHGDGIVRKIRGENKYRIHLRIRQRHMVIGDHLLDLRVFFLGRLRLFRQNIAGIFDTHILHGAQRRQMRPVGDATTADNSNLFHPT